MKTTWDIKGVVLISALFLLIITSLAIAILGNIITSQNKTSLGLILRVQARYAAESALEWAKHEINNGAWCTSSTSKTINFTESNLLNEFAVTLNCTKSTHTETTNYSLYVVKATAEKGTYGTMNYVKATRSLILRVN